MVRFKEVEVCVQVNCVDLKEYDAPNDDDSEEHAEPVEGERLLFMMQKVLRRVERTAQNAGHHRRQHPVDAGASLSAALDSMFLRQSRSSRNAFSQNGGQDRRPDPGKYSSRVLAAAPIAHVYLYRACMRLHARPGMTAAHLSAGVAAGAVLYNKRRRLRRLPCSLERS